MINNWSKIVLVQFESEELLKDSVSMKITIGTKN